ncbi:hypothetical protein [Lacimicrobium alkaliphilum]|uniref:Uncharacterized protein n=1 Tax=Lacimicrobium alkaliphilum TaxID=1526571 RepID=A0ABQ1RIA8_9ALTE|nr:hypothetical protein [Lacimicrobium alkaliphilum]GGD71278.1 hypothetical protein GCM10011357_28010 [Lacimicrobium alkaliphilum]
MSAAPAKNHDFQLFNRSSDDVVRARAFLGNHARIIEKALTEATEKHRETIKELAKV